MNEKELVDQVTLEIVLRWIVNNQNDEQAMDAINRLTYSFTPKYKARGQNGSR